MKETELQDYLNKLDELHPVSPPPYLFTRIQQKIQNNLENKFSIKTSMALGFSLMLILVINLYVIRSIETNTTGAGSTEDVFKIMPNNNLYQ